MCKHLCIFISITFVCILSVHAFPEIVFANTMLYCLSYSNPNANLKKQNNSIVDGIHFISLRYSKPNLIKQSNLINSIQSHGKT